MPLVCLTKKNRLKYLQTLLQEATPNDLLPLPMTEEEVFQRLGSTKPTVQTCTVDIDVIDVAELLISMGDSLKEQAKGPNNRIAALVKQTKSAEDNADAVIEAVRDTDVYFSCNMQQPQDLSSLPEAVQKLVKLRQHFQSQEWWEHAFGYQDPSNATLWLIGSSKHGSQFHVDWSEAKNIAWATDGKVSKSCFKQPASPWECSPAQLRCPCHTVHSVMTGSVIVSKSCICLWPHATAISGVRTHLHTCPGGLGVFDIKCTLTYRCYITHLLCCGSYSIVEA
ncbi:hypothetical protein ABBQ38_008465 [Trebouxia sp. C0009 RCD-2024]